MKYIATIFLLLFATYPVLAQQSNNEALRRRYSEINKRATEIDRQIEQLTAEKRLINSERETLLKNIAKNEEEEAFQHSPGKVVVGIQGDQALVLMIGGVEKAVRLSGMLVRLGKSEEAIRFLKEKTSEGIVYIRCANDPCSEAYIYTDRKGPSLNAELVRLNIAYTLQNAKYDLNPNAESNTGTSTQSENKGITIESVAPSSPSSSSSAGTDVHVRGYYRKDGTYVRPHTRSAPGKKKN